MHSSLCNRDHRGTPQGARKYGRLLDPTSTVQPSNRVHKAERGWRSRSICAFLGSSKRIMLLHSNAFDHIVGWMNRHCIADHCLTRATAQA